MLGERENAARYLRQMMDAAPEASEPLAAAANLYGQVAALSGKVWLWGDSMGPDVAEALADPETRRPIAQAVRAAAALEAEAVGHLEAALAVLAADDGANA